MNCFKSTVIQGDLAGTHTLSKNWCIFISDSQEICQSLLRSFEELTGAPNGSVPQNISFLGKFFAA